MINWELRERKKQEGVFTLCRGQVHVETFSEEQCGIEFFKKAASKKDCLDVVYADMKKKSKFIQK